MVAQFCSTEVKMLLIYHRQKRWEFHTWAVSPLHFPPRLPANPENHLILQSQFSRWEEFMQHFVPCLPLRIAIPVNLHIAVGLNPPPASLWKTMSEELNNARPSFRACDGCTRLGV